MLEKFLRKCDTLRNEGKLHAILAQEHHLDPAREHEIRTKAALKHFLVEIAFAPANPNDGVHHGGTLTLIDEKSATIKNTKTHDSGALEITIDWMGTDYRLLNVYAPAKPLQRVKFYENFRKYLEDDMISGGIGMLSRMYY